MHTLCLSESVWQRTQLFMRELSWLLDLAVDKYGSNTITRWWQQVQIYFAGLRWQPKHPNVHSDLGASKGRSTQRYSGFFLLSRNSMRSATRSLLWFIVEWTLILRSRFRFSSWLRLAASCGDFFNQLQRIIIWRRSDGLFQLVIEGRTDLCFEALNNCTINIFHGSGLILTLSSESATLAGKVSLSSNVVDVCSLTQS